MRRSYLITGVLTLALSAGSAMAGTVGFQLKMGRKFNVPTLRLTNTSSSATITDFVMSIGKLNYNFDIADTKTKPGSLGVSAGMIKPDSVHHGMRTDELQITPVGLTAGKFFRFRTDIDPDNKNKRIDYRHVWFDLDGSDTSDNAQLSVTFSDGTILDGVLPDYQRGDGPFFYYNRSIQTEEPPLSGGPRVNPIPLPPALWGGLSLLAGLKLIGTTRRFIGMYI